MYPRIRFHIWPTPTPIPHCFHPGWLVNANTHLGTRCAWSARRPPRRISFQIRTQSRYLLEHLRTIVKTCGHSGHDWAQWARMVTVGTIAHSGHDWAQWAQLVTFPRCQFRYEICLVDFCVRIPFPTPATCSSRAGNHFSRNVLHRSRHVWQYNF